MTKRELISLRYLYYYNRHNNIVATFHVNDLAAHPLWPRNTGPFGLQKQRGEEGKREHLYCNYCREKSERVRMLTNKDLVPVSWCRDLLKAEGMERERIAVVCGGINEEDAVRA